MERQGEAKEVANSTTNWMRFLVIDQHQFQCLCWILAPVEVAHQNWALKNQTQMVNI